MNCCIRNLFILLTVISFGGCGNGRPSLVDNVTGTVTLDGEPLDGATVSLQRIVEDDTEFQ